MLLSFSLQASGFGSGDGAYEDIEGMDEVKKVVEEIEYTTVTAHTHTHTHVICVRPIEPGWTRTKANSSYPRWLGGDWNVFVCAARCQLLALGRRRRRRMRRGEGREALERVLHCFTLREIPRFRQLVLCPSCFELWDRLSQPHGPAEQISFHYSSSFFNRRYGWIRGFIPLIPRLCRETCQSLLCLYEWNMKVSHTEKNCPRRSEIIRLYNNTIVIMLLSFGMWLWP